VVFAKNRIRTLYVDLERLRSLFILQSIGQRSRKLFSQAMQNQVNRRKFQRVPVSFLIHCLRTDLSRIGGKAYDLSEGGIAIKTNCPVRSGEQLTLEFVEQDGGTIHKVKGEVVWSKFHDDTVAQVGAMFTAGIKFLVFEGSFKPLLGNLCKGHLANNLDKI